MNQDYGFKMIYKKKSSYGGSAEDLMKEISMDETYAENLVEEIVNGN